MSSTSLGGKLYIKIDDPTCTKSGEYHLAGTKISGSVCVEIFSALPRNSSLNAYFVGLENAKVRCAEIISNYYTYRDVKKEITKIPLKLSSKDMQDISPGRYEYPFEILLPEDLPSSMYCSGKGGYSEVVYKVKAELSGAKYCTEHVIQLLSSPLPNIPKQSIIQPQAEVVHQYCCCPMGTIIYSANVENTCVGQDEDFNIDFTVKNDTKFEISHVEVFIVEDINWWIDENDNRVRRKLVTKIFDEPDQIKKKPEKCDIEPQAIHKQLEGNDYRVKLHVPPYALQTYKGQCCKVRHDLTIYIFTKGECVDNLEMNTSFHIGTPSSLIQYPEKFELAPNYDLPGLVMPSAPPSDWDSDKVVVAPPVIASKVVVEETPDDTIPIATVTTS